MAESTDAKNGAVKDSYVTGQNSEGVKFRGSLLKLTNLVVVIELYSPAAVLRSSESLPELKIVLNGRTLYSGRAVVRNLMNTADTVVKCELTLQDDAWSGLDIAGHGQPADWSEEYRTFLTGWQKLYKVRPEYKLILADMQTYFADLQLWLGQVELGMRMHANGNWAAVERQVAEELAAAIIPTMDDLFDRFETVASDLDTDAQAVYQQLMRRQLHPLVLCAPFALRTFQKPLGYAGDYEMVNMIWRNAPEGGSLFAKILNLWFVRQPPAIAHRNRINYLVKNISNEILRRSGTGQNARILSLACGPALEVQRFVEESPLVNRADFTLLDFDQETLEYAEARISASAKKNIGARPIRRIKKSIQQLLKESSRLGSAADREQYDLIYCAGLFDYLSDQVCHAILNLMYDWLSPGGLLIVTNVEPSNPLRNGMEHLLDWHLIYRTGPELGALKPALAVMEEIKVYSDITGVNVFMEVRRSEYA